MIICCEELKLMLHNHQWGKCS